MRNRVAIDSQAFAQMSKAYVVSACGTVDDDMIEKLQVGPDGEKFLRNPDFCGGSVIVGPNSPILAGPLGAEEDILYAECNLKVGINMKLRHDFAGHYNRPDIFQMHTNRSVPRLYTAHGPEEPIALSDTAPNLKGLPDPETPTHISQSTRAQLGDGKNQGHSPADDD